MSVSIHAPVKGATDLGGVEAHAGQVSIHAPVKGATHQRHHGRQQSRVSIHAPVKGATFHPTVENTYRMFQSTRP